jgi:ATP-dependent Lon protease
MRTKAQRLRLRLLLQGNIAAPRARSGKGGHDLAWTRSRQAGCSCLSRTARPGEAGRGATGARARPERQVMGTGRVVLVPKDAESIPERLPILPLTGTVVFPHVLVPVAVTEHGMVEVVSEASRRRGQVVLVAVRPGRHPGESTPQNPPFFGVGTLGHVLQAIELPDGTLRALLQGRARVRIQEFIHQEGRWFARAESLPSEEGDGLRVEALRHVIQDLFREILTFSPQLPEEVQAVLDHITNAEQLGDFIAGHLNIPVERKQELLEEANVARRLERLAAILGEERKVLQYGSELQQKIKDNVEKAQREFWLREQLRVIQQELGEDEVSELGRLRQQIEAAGMPEAARKQAERELRRLEQMVPQAAEYQVVRNYLDWLVSLPWSKESPETIDLERARQVLDRDHFDLEEAKERIIEYLAVRKLNPGLHGPILCFIGPPGVGKTSLGRSISEALGRKFVRISLGGVHDEAEIRGHRRTYVGAMPGRIIQGVRRAGVRNPVFVLDEIDKMGQDFRGDPTAALLEVLDPAQNHSFSDHYLEVEFDLSRVLFVATGNTLATVPPALMDRLEVLTLPGYTPAEKFEIARRHLIPRQLEQAGLGADRVSISDGALRRLIAEYTREAGVRELERQIGRLTRKVAVRVVSSGAPATVRITRQNLPAFLGKRRFENELAGRADEVGTATALAYTPAGGQILFVEAVRMPGAGRIRLTGHLGGVMKESAQAALSYVRSHCAALGIPERCFQETDVHVHVPAGATPKDGPSAGVALVVALASLFTGRPVRRDVAMTGEVTLRGHVLPVGGIKEKVIGAVQAGIRSVLLPRRNEADLEDVPADIKAQLNFVLVEDVAEALAHALKEGRPQERKELGLVSSAESAEAA